MKKLLSLLVLTILISAQSIFAQTEEVQLQAEEVTPTTEGSSAEGSTPQEIPEADRIRLEELMDRMTQPDFTEDMFTEEEGAFVRQYMQRPSAVASGGIEGTVNCFDYYTFGSVQVDLESDTVTTLTGSEMPFRGTVVNSNNYPLVDGIVYVKVFRKDENLEQIQGHHLVDQFVAKDGIALPANGTLPIDFVWKVPAHALAGEYQIATFFVTSGKFNLLGLTFTDDVVGNILDFTVTSENTGAIFFDKSSIMVNDTSFKFAAYPPRVTHVEPVTVSMDIQNTTDEAAQVPVIYTLYKWDAMHKDNTIETQSELVDLAGGETKTLSFTARNIEHTVYFLVAEAYYQDTKSVLDVRFVREGVEGVRINFPSLTSYPLKSGEPTSVFSCVHGSGNLPLIENNKLVLTLTDTQGNTIHTYTYEGGVTGDMMGVKSDFTPERDYGTVTLTAELFHNDVKVDSAVLTYDCNTLDANSCAGDSEEQSGSGEGNSNTDTGKTLMTLISVVTLCILVFGGVLLFVVKNKHHENIQ